VIRKKDRIRLPNQPGKEPAAYFFESLDFPVMDRKMEAYFAEFPVRSKPSQLDQHEGEELIYVFKGRLAVNINGTDSLLETGDAMYFDAAVPHSYRSDGKTSSTAIIAVAK